MHSIPEIIYIDARVRGLPATQRILSYMPQVQTELITDIDSMQAPSEFSEAKRQWLITCSPKKWYHQMKKDNGTTVIDSDFVTNTPYDCSHSHIPVLTVKRPFLTLIVNLEEAMADLGRRCIAQSGQQFVLQCGRMGDALALDHVTHATETLISFFAWTPNARLELWTRTANVEQLLPLSHHGRTTVVFAMTPDDVIAREEQGTASVAERLAAAKQLADKGYRIAYAIDPIIQYDGWEADYDDLIEKMLASTPVSALSRIDLSCFHFPRGLQQQAFHRFPESRIFLGELVPVNGCYRYFRPMREKIYRHLLETIQRQGQEFPVHITHEHGMTATLEERMTQH